MADYNKAGKISIISAIYNVSDHLQKRKLLPILNQTYHNWELILVDDGSTDDSGKICEQFALLDSRIKVFHKKNEGAGSARNLALDHASGDFIWFYDVDDDVEPFLLDYCVKQMEDRNIDLLFFGFRAITLHPYYLEEDIMMNETIINCQEDLKNCYIDNILLTRYGGGLLCTKFFRKSFLDNYNIRFENQRIQQDEVLFLNLYPFLNKAYISSMVLYIYYIYKKGNTRSRYIPDRFEIYTSVRDHFEKLREIWNIRDVRFEEYLQNRFWNNINESLRFNLFHPDCPLSIEDKKKEMRRIVDHKYSKEAVLWAGEQKLSIEDTIYLSAIRRNNFRMLSLSSSLFKFIRSVIRPFKRCIFRF